MITIDPKARELMNKDGLSSFPDECCGFFYGHEDGVGNRHVTEILVVNNAKEGDKRRRFEISAKDYMLGERYALEKGLQLLGVYLRTDLQCYARLLHLIAHYELGNYDLLEYLFKSVYRFMAKMENLSVVEEEIL